LLRIPLGRQAGRVETRFTGAPGIDDFAFVGDTVLVANNGVNEVVLIRPDGTSKTVLTAAGGLQQPTAVGADERTATPRSTAVTPRRTTRRWSPTSTTSSCSTTTRR
jgi:hypothetical protein